ncbi:MAG: hypothetical protein E6534_09000 [Corynebacterium kroppenstedtii]|nr:hypothetical protein [Corynebacterium kroppenstedtii]MDU7503720.1 hypothetical protein [Corynebacterium kroppenstedtii]
MVGDVDGDDVAWGVGSSPVGIVHWVLHDRSHGDCSDPARKDHHNSSFTKHL